MIKKWVKERIGVGLLIVGALLLLWSIGEMFLGANPRPFLNRAIGSGGLAFVMVSIQEMIKHQVPRSSDQQRENEEWYDERRVWIRLRSKAIAYDVLIFSLFVFSFQRLLSWSLVSIDELLRSLAFLWFVGIGSYLLARIIYESSL